MFDRIRQIPRAIVAAVKKEPKARTGPQDQTGSGPMDLYQLLSQNCANGSLWERAPSGNVRTWRSMCENPTIALALAASKAPVKAAQWGVEADEGVPEERVQLIRDYLLPLRPTILGEGLRAVEYGNSKFEVVWTIESGKMVIGKLKPLLTEKTEILKDKNTGAFIGLKNGDVTLDAHDSLVISFDGEAGNLEGKSRLENVRQRAWWPWEQILIRVSQYSTKAAGIIPQVSYPVGSSVGPSGETISNTTIAKAIAANMARGGTVIMPKKMEAWAEELLKKNIDASKLMSWEISFVEARNQHGAELIEMFKHFETLMVRGLLQPERSLLEGSAGTKAEAQTHGDTATSIAEDMSEQLMRIINWHLVDRVLEANYGPEAKGTVRLCAAPLVDEQADLLRAILTTVLEAPGNIDLLLGMLDLEAGMEQLGLPVKKEAIYPEPGDLGKDDPNVGPDGKPLDNPGAVVASIFRAARVLRSAG